MRGTAQARAEDGAGAEARPEPANPADTPDTLRRALPVFYRHWSGRLLTAYAAAALAARAALGAPGLGDLAVAAGVLALWPLQEWLIHVFILHFRPFTLFGRSVDFEVPRLHRLHHLDPWRTELVFIPGRVFVMTPVLIGILLAATRPPADLACTGLAAYFLLGLHYEWIHFLIHSRYRPRSAHYRRVWRNHRLHHFKNEQYWYGVTMLGGDRALRTAPEPRAIPTSPTCRTLLSVPAE